MRLNIKVLYLVIIFCLLMACQTVHNKRDSQDKMYFGKNLTITISESEFVDAAYLKNILDGKIENELQKFNLWDTQEFIKLIEYMDEKCLVIDNGKYTFNQAWKFDDGYFLLNNYEKREVFKFKKISPIQ